jgi:hypothetical protein
MYAVMEEHLKTDKGISLVSKYESDNNAQSIYFELKKHGTSSTAAWLAGDTVMKYLKNARYPGEWRGTSFGFVLHWQEQLAKYEELDLEVAPPKQKLQMLQNAVGDVEALAQVKLMNDHDIARGHPPLTYERYVQVLLSACSTYDSQRSSSDRKKRVVYQSELDREPDPYDDNDYYDYGVDTDVTDIMAYATDTTRFGSKSVSSNQSSSRITYSERIKLPEEERNKIFAKRKQERLDKTRNRQASNPVTRRANTHNIDTYIDIDNIIDNAMMNQGYETISDNEIKADTNESTNNLLAYLAGQQTSSGDIRVLAAKRAPAKQKKRQVTECASAPPTITMNGDTYYLHKGESIHYQGHQYFSHMTECYYRVGQHTISDMDYALVDRGDNGGICGTNMLVLEGSERFC